MACFIVPATEAVVTTIVEKKMEAREKRAEAESQEPVTLNEVKPISLSRKMKWLNNMLWGGSALLAFEHVWHGEVVPFFPFLTAAANPEDAMLMLHEMSTVGVTMAALVTLVWIGMVTVSNVIEKKSLESVEMKRVK